MSTDLLGAGTVEDELLELLLADDDLVRAEFDAIIAAAGLDGAQPPRGRPPGREGRPRGDDRACRPGRGDRAPLDLRARATAPWRDHVGVWAVGRQRSPPYL
ncbi:MAG: hypothetical protein JWP82_281 [Humibacillus sp.]|nr:hypothetical protein [Humibacillus sp.]